MIVIREDRKKSGQKYNGQIGYIGGNYSIFWRCYIRIRIHCRDYRYDRSI